jgi:hypothetical protein
MSLSPTGAYTDAYADDRRQQRDPEQAGDADPVVFVDSTGRRALLLRRAAVVFTAAVLVYAGMLGVAFMGGPSLAPSQLSPFDGAGTARDPGGDSVRDPGGAGTARDPNGDRARPAASPSAGQTARPCRKHCGKGCWKHQHPGKPCRKKPFKKAFDGPGGAAPARSAPSVVEGR